MGSLSVALRRSITFVVVLLSNPREIAVIPRWVQLVLLPLALLLLWVVLKAAGGVIFIFTVAALIALLFNPLVSRLRRHLRLPRGVAVLTVYLGLTIIFAGIGLALANPIANQISTLRSNIPQIVNEANNRLADVQTFLDEKGVQLEIKRQGQTALQTLGDNLSRGSGEVVSFTRDVLTLVVEAGFALVLILVVSVYMLLYGDRIGQVVRSLIPSGTSPQDDYPTRVQRAVFGYVRGQLLFSVIMGTSAGVLIWVFAKVGIFPQGGDYALFFGVFFGVAELIPYIGPFIGAAPAVLIALLSNQPLDALWLTLGFIALQQIEGHIVAPNVFATVLRINPLLVIFALLLGGQVYGVIGAFVALPMAAILRESFDYFRHHLVFEPWRTPSSVDLLEISASEQPNVKSHA